MTTKLAGATDPPPPPVSVVYSRVQCGKNITIPEEKVDGCLLGPSPFEKVVWESDLDLVTCEDCRDAYGLYALGEL